MSSFATHLPVLQSPAGRGFAVMPLAILTTLALTYFMMSLIANQSVVIDDSPRLRISPVVLDIPDPQPPEVNRLEPPQPIEPLPELDIDLFSSEDFGSKVVTLPPTATPANLGEAPNIGFSNSALISLTRVRPQYPQRAVTRGIEGYVDLQFDISSDGIPSNISVIAAEPEGYFEKAAQNAVRRWKYRVPEQDGVPKAVSGHQERIRFVLGEN